MRGLSFDRDDGLWSFRKKMKGLRAEDVKNAFFPKGFQFKFTYPSFRNRRPSGLQDHQTHLKAANISLLIEFSGSNNYYTSVSLHALSVFN